MGSNLRLRWYRPVSTDALGFRPRRRTAPRPSSAAAVETDGERSRVLTKGQQNRAKKQGFILGELRPFAMKLHTRQQASRRCERHRECVAAAMATVRARLHEAAEVVAADLVVEEGEEGLVRSLPGARARAGA